MASLGAVASHRYILRSLGSSSIRQRDTQRDTNADANARRARLLAAKMQRLSSSSSASCCCPRPIDSPILDPAACEQMRKKSSTNAMCRKYK